MNYTARYIVFAAIVGLIVGTILYLGVETTDKTQSEQDIGVDLNSQTREAKAKRFGLAKEISSPDAFINTDAISIEELIGDKIVLVDFWTFSCINCQRTLPYLNSWYEKYSDQGLVILGIHTPEFEFEKEYDNVVQAVEKWGVEYPVIMDNDFSTWRSYKNRFWPHKYLIDIDGFIVYDHIGEGGYEETEAKIVELLNERSQRLGMASVNLDESEPENIDEVNFRQVKTREMYLGYQRLEYLSNLPSSDCFDKSCDFSKPSATKSNTFNLGGQWKLNPENAELVGDSGSIVIRFDANKVNLVAGGDNISAEIYLDGQLVNDNQAGAAVSNGQVRFSEDDLYNLIDLQGEYGEHILEIRILEGGLSAWAFTFG